MKTQQKRKELEQVIILTNSPIFPRSLDTNFQNRLRHKLSSVRLSKLNKAPVVEGKAGSPKASKIPLVTVTVTDPSGQCVNAVD